MADYEVFINEEIFSAGYPSLVTLSDQALTNAIEDWFIERGLSMRLNPVNVQEITTVMKMSGAVLEVPILKRTGWAFCFEDRLTAMWFKLTWAKS